MEFQVVCQKIRKIEVNFKGSDEKEYKVAGIFMGVMLNRLGNPGGQLEKKIDILNNFEEVQTLLI